MTLPTKGRFQRLDRDAIALGRAISTVLANIRFNEHQACRLLDEAARALAALSYPAAVIFVASASMKLWQDFVPPERRQLIYNASTFGAESHDDASRHALRNHLNIAPGEQMAISVGTLCERKSQVDFARAVAASPAPIRPVFVGKAEPGYRERVETALGDALPRAIFTGPVPDAGKLIAAADVLVCSSRFEAFPRTLLEAAALRTPIIATSLEGTKERLTDGESALFYSPGDVGLLSRLLERLAGDRPLGRKLAETANARVTQAWTYEDMIASYAEQVHKALA